MIRKKSKYLVRPNDMHIFEMDKSNSCYRSYTTRNVRRSDGSRPLADEHYTYENLTEDYNFFPIDKFDIPMYEYFNNIRTQYISWQARSDGHGGVKGGTFEEYLEYYNMI